MTNTEKARILQQAAEIMETLAGEHGEIDNPADELHGHRLNKAADLLRKESETLAQMNLLEAL